MGRPANHEHVERTLRALAILRSEPGWHPVDRLAQLVGAKPRRLADDLRRCCHAADDWHFPLIFGSDLDPPHPDGEAVVQLAADVPFTLPLPSSRVDLIRLAVLADGAARLDPDHPRSAVLRALHERLTTIIGSPTVDAPGHEPTAADAVRAAIRSDRNVTFTYRSLTDQAPSRRTVTPLGVERQGKWWILRAVHAGPDRVEASYRLDRIVGDVEDAGPAGVSAPTLAEPPFVTPRTAVRLRLHINDQWVTDDLDPLDVRPVGSELVEVTVNLYPPVGERLSRLLFLTDPRTSTVVSGQTFLDAHRRHVADALTAG